MTEAIKEISYEMSCLIDGKLNEQEAESVFKQTAEMVSKSGKLVKEESPRRMRLAYPIAKKQEAFLAVIEFENTAERIEEIKKELNENSQIVRYLIVRKKEEKKKEKERTKSKERRKTEETVKKEGKKEKSSLEQKVELEKIGEKLDQILDESK